MRGMRCRPKLWGIEFIFDLRFFVKGLTYVRTINDSGHSRGKIYQGIPWLKSFIGVGLHLPIDKTVKLSRTRHPIKRASRKAKIVGPPYNCIQYSKF